MNWPGDEEPPRREAPNVMPLVTSGHFVPVAKGELPTGRSRRDIAVISLLLLLLILLGGLVWFLGPLPRVFPLIS
jgi:hypothetical protein